MLSPIEGKLGLHYWYRTLVDKPLYYNFKKILFESFVPSIIKGTTSGPSLIREIPKTFADAARYERNIGRSRVSVLGQGLQTQQQMLI